MFCEHHGSQFLTFLDRHAQPRGNKAWLLVLQRVNLLAWHCITTGSAERKETLLCGSQSGKPGLWALALSRSRTNRPPFTDNGLIEYCARGLCRALGSSAWVSFLSWLLSKIFTLCLSSKTVPGNQQTEGARENPSLPISPPHPPATCFP